MKKTLLVLGWILFWLDLMAIAGGLISNSIPRDIMVQQLIDSPSAISIAGTVSVYFGANFLGILAFGAGVIVWRKDGVKSAKTLANLSLFLLLLGVLVVFFPGIFAK